VSSYVLEAEIHPNQNAWLHNICGLYLRFAKNDSERSLYIASSKENLKKKLREKFRNTATYYVVINSISVVKFSVVGESILCYQDRWIVVLFGYPVQQLSETPWYNLQITVSITTRIT
jgi:hypothetical protein